MASNINKNLHDQCMLLYSKVCEDAGLGKIRDLINTVETGSRPKGGAKTSGVPSIGAEKIEKLGVYDYSTEKYIDVDYFNRLNRGIVLSGDVFLYKDGAYTGKSSMAYDGFPHEKCAVNEHVFLLRTKDSLAQGFLYFTLQNETISKTLHTLACGKAAQPGLNQQELLSVDIPLPSDDKIMEYENQIKPMIGLIISNAKENRKLSLIRDSLLPKLMSGELDVSNLSI